MILAADTGMPVDWAMIITSFAIFVLSGAAVMLGFRPVRAIVLRQEREYDRVLRGQMLIDVAPRSVTLLTLVVIVLTGGFGYVASSGSGILTFLAAVAGAFLPRLVIKYLRARRLRKLEEQIVDGVTTLTAGVRAGLNLVQALQMLARDGVPPIRQEFSHLLREYEYGIPLEESMNSAAARIGSNDYRLLFAALQTHRERGGNLGETLDRIAESIREIQRLEKRVETLTAQGRTTARWLSVFPAVVMGLMYMLFDPSGVQSLFVDDVGRLILVVIVLLNLIAYLWIRKIISIDI